MILFHQLTCPNCFFISVFDTEEKGKKAQRLCDYCLNNPEAITDDKKRLERILDMMPKTNMSHIPEILRLMYSVFTVTKEEIL